MRHLQLTIATVALLTGVFVMAAARPALGAPARRSVDIVKVSGLIDPINANLVRSSIGSARSSGALLLVLQLNSTGGTVSRRVADSLSADMVRSPVPVVVWVGGSGRSRAYGAAYELLRSSAYSGEAPGSRVGRGPGRLGAPDPLAHRTMSGDDAADAGFISDGAPTLVEFLGDLSGKTLDGVKVDLGVTGPPGSVARGFNPDLTFDFSQLSIVPKLMHTAASPNVAFVMLLIALALFVFEFFTAGVGVAAGTGIVFGILSAYGLGVLPTRPWAVALLLISMAALAIDIQAGVPRFWTGVGAVTFLGGAIWLYHGQAVSPWVIVVMAVLLALFALSGMPSMIRTRFSTPTIGREGMIGELGVASSTVDPEGTVKVHGAPWRARTNRATPISAGDVIRVVAIDGLLLEVEPEEGGAHDAHH